MLKIYFLFLCFIFLSSCSLKSASNKKVAETIPITMANLRGHQSLYNEGWFAITSTKNALLFAEKHAVENASQALAHAISSVSSQSKNYAENIKDDILGGVKTSRAIYQAGSNTTKAINKGTRKISKKLNDYAAFLGKDAWRALIKGNLSLGKRSKEDRDALSNISGNYFKNLKDDFSNLGYIADSLTSSGSKEFFKFWKEAFDDARKSFMDSYDTSGESENSLMGLMHILYGYSKVLYYGVAKPVSISGVTGTKKLVKLAYLPVGSTISIVGRSIESIGMTLYYTTALGVKIVSPTIEAGFLSALSLLSLGSSGMTYIGGHSLGLMNQLGTLSVAPVLGVADTTVSASVDSVKLVTFISYDITVGAAKIIFNEASAGVVLGYNALLSLPVHLFLATSDAVFFLAWDGPRLVLAMAKGELDERSLSELPVGSVVDLKALQENENMKVEIISRDYKLIEKVLHELPKDMRIEK